MKIDAKTLDTDLLAELEVAWWESYHTRNFTKLQEDVKKLRKAQYGVEISSESAANFVNAAEAYIDYKKALAQADDDEAERCLDECRQLMKKHYTGLSEKLK
jgi:hypothetical protein